MSRPKIHTFQTVRLYTAAGQRIAWVLIRSGIVYMCDRDRNLDGFLSVPKHPQPSRTRTPSNSEVLNAYDHMMRPVFDNELWREGRELHDALMAAAGKLPHYQKGDPVVRR